jgi:uncharacterized membrane protein YeaQ/YmgE (transglycosylase-associated protein family)
MEISEILSIVTFFVTLICGVIAKKHPKIDNKIIPVQNIAIGVVMAIIDYIITKDFTTAIAVSGLVAGGTYDIIHNLNKLKGDE